MEDATPSAREAQADWAALCARHGWRTGEVSAGPVAPDAEDDPLTKALRPPPGLDDFHASERRRLGMTEHQYVRHYWRELAQAQREERRERRRGGGFFFFGIFDGEG